MSLSIPIPRGRSLSVRPPSPPRFPVGPGPYAADRRVVAPGVRDSIKAGGVWVREEGCDAPDGPPRPDIVMATRREGEGKRADWQGRVSAGTRRRAISTVRGCDSRGNSVHTVSSPPPLPVCAGVLQRYFIIHERSGLERSTSHSLHFTFQIFFHNIVAIEMSNGKRAQQAVSLVFISG